MIAYFDSSAFIKLVVPEEGSHEARSLYSSSTRVVSSRLLFPEACAGLGRAMRMGRLDSTATKAALIGTRALLTRIDPVEVDEALADNAGELATALGLRGYDAVHLASYERVEAGDSVLVAADGDLVRAALSLGHAVAVPGG